MAKSNEQIAKAIQRQLRKRLGLPQPTRAEQKIFVQDIAGIRPKKKRKRSAKKKK